MSENWYDRNILPYMIDLACGVKPVHRQREKVVPLAQGRVLEIGIGTGLNLRHYDKRKVTKLVGLDPAMQMHKLAEKRRQESGIDVELVGLSAEKIPLADASFDTIVITFTLCTIPDPLAALKEMKRVLAPGGKLLYCEHGAAPDENVLHWQKRVTPYWKKFAGGCHLDRDIPKLLRDAGFSLQSLETRYLPGPKMLTYNYWGVAMADSP
jgi:ubiquinone/menaquinone biosynthesis C-methylase UbiE